MKIPKKITTVEGRAIPKPAPDQDTDLIMPARFLKDVTFAKMGEYVYSDERAKAAEKGDVHPFDDPKYAGATILLGGENYGCGSSREHAPQGLLKYRIKAVIADSFARIFFRNCINNGFYAIECEGIARQVKNGDELEIDIEKGMIKDLTNEKEFKFFSSTFGFNL